MPLWFGDHGFLDKPTDATGLTQVGARYYDPRLGRFISVDPIMDLTDPQQWHGYSYANNNPITYSDPTGLRPMQHDGGGARAKKPGYEATRAAPAAAKTTRTVRAPVTTSESQADRVYRRARNVGVDVVNGGASVLNAAKHHPEDLAAMLAGALLMAIGSNGEVGGIGLTVTGVGSAAGIPLAAASAGLIAIGGGMVAAGGIDLIGHAATDSRIEVMQRGTDETGGSSPGSRGAARARGDAGGGMSSSERRTLDDALRPDKLDHIFDPKHNFAPLVRQYGSREAAMEQIVRSIGGPLPQAGRFQIAQSVGGQTVVIRGAVVNGVPRIGTAFTP